MDALGIALIIIGLAFIGLTVQRKFSEGPEKERQEELRSKGGEDQALDS
jgi:hypothetical protein